MTTTVSVGRQTSVVDPSNWRKDKRKTSERGYGWKWQQARAAFLARPENALCARCQTKGKLTPATVVDHIKSHHGDQVLFWDRNNWQPLCKICHDIKTATEDAGLNSGAHTHPEWLPAPACRVVLVTGAPGSGKTTYAQQQARIDDQVIDLDDCFEDVCGVHGHKADRKHLKAALRLRNSLLAGLARKKGGTAYVIVGAPTQAEVDWWIGKLNAEHVRIVAPQSECERRVGVTRRLAVVDWFDAARRNEWSPPSGRVRRVGEDGWPVA